MKRLHGFTLIEILIALAVFAILSTITSSAIYHAFNTRARVTLQADRLSALQLAITVLNRDTQQIISRSVRGDGLQVVPALIGEPHYLEFTRQNPLTRVAFSCRKSQLVRRRWDTLDSPVRNRYQEKILLDGLSHCQFAYLAQGLQVLPDWTGGPLNPLAIQLSADVEGWGKMSLLFKLDGGTNGE